MQKKSIIILLAASVVLLFLTGCGIGMFAQSPVSVSLLNWRGAEEFRVATTSASVEGQTNETIQADKTTETQAAVNTSSGSAATASQSQSNAEDKK